MSLASTIRQLELRAKSHPIGRLQEIRGGLKRKTVVPNGGRLFSWQTTDKKKKWAFHYGGRKELQFNIGFDPDHHTFRHGVAFSLNASRSLPDPMQLVPKVARFNEFLRCQPMEYSNLRMWHWNGERRSGERRPEPIQSELVKAGVFIFLGGVQPASQINYELILDDFDGLLPLYRFVEENQAIPETSGATNRFEFKSGCTNKRSATTASIAEQQLDIDLRHNDIQKALHDQLAALYGPDNVGTECRGCTGKVDVVVRRNQKYWFYEIKPLLPTRACIRDAIAQLLEYSYWPGAQQAERLVIVGERELDPESRRYLKRFRNEFSLPLSYKQFDLKKRRLVDE